MVCLTACSILSVFALVLLSAYLKDRCIGLKNAVQRYKQESEFHQGKAKRDSATAYARGLAAGRLEEKLKWQAKLDDLIDADDDDSEVNYTGGD